MWRANGSVSQNRCKKCRVTQTSCTGVQVLAPPPSPTLGVNLSEAREREVCSDQSPLHLESGLRGRSQPSPACAGDGQRSRGEQKRETLLPGSSVSLGLLPPGSPGGRGSSWGGVVGGTSSKEAESWQAARGVHTLSRTPFQLSIHFSTKIFTEKPNAYFSVFS